MAVGSQQDKGTARLKTSEAAFTTVPASPPVARPPTHLPSQPHLLGDALDVWGAGVGLYPVVIVYLALGQGVDLESGAGQQ